MTGEAAGASHAKPPVPVLQRTGDCSRWPERWADPDVQGLPGRQQCVPGHGLQSLGSGVINDFAGKTE